MVDALENVPKSQDEKPCGRLMPAWIERQDAEIALEFKGARAAVRRQEAQHGGHPFAQPVDSRIERKGRTVKANRIGEEDIQHLLAPVQIEVVGKRWIVKVGKGRVKRGEGTV